MLPAQAQQPLQETAEVLERIFERPLRFNESDLARSVSHPGDDSRLRLALGKLLRGALLSAAGVPCPLQLNTI